MRRIGLFISLLMVVVFAKMTQAQFVHYLDAGPTPWTSEPKVSGEQFRFVVIGDLTGGEAPGVFESAVQKINQLAPDFVVSVGDLIEGYTLDDATIQKQWSHFEERVARLQAPFFYLPGNHDYTNQKLADIWRKKLGKDYYAFQVNQSLFLMMNMYEQGVTGLSEKQVDYFKKALKAHDRNNPVYVFSHAPLWKVWEQKGYRELKPLLYQRRATFFCGHEHHYLYFEDQGNPHYMMAKTGGGFATQRPELGEFDHMLWVTGSRDESNVANILLDGMISSRIVDNSSESIVNILRSESWFRVEPVIADSNKERCIHSQIVISNDSDQPMQAEGTLPVNDFFAFFPAAISEILPPKSQRQIPVWALRKDKTPLDQWEPVFVELTASFPESHRQRKAHARKWWIVDNRKVCTPVSVKSDTIVVEKPEQVDESWCWHGLSDGSFEFTTTHDNQHIFLWIKTRDDTLLADPGDPRAIQDKLEVRFSPDPANTEENLIKIICLANKPVVVSWGPDEKQTGRIDGKCEIRGNSLVARIKLPADLLETDRFCLNIGFVDHDDPTSSSPSVVWWKPKAGSRQDYPGAGVILVLEEN